MMTIEQHIKATEADKWMYNTDAGMVMRSYTHQSAIYFNRQVLEHGTMLAEGGKALVEALEVFVSA